MAVLGSKLIKRLFTASLFRLFRLFYCAIQRLNWELNGTGSQLRQARQPQNYDRCAQVLDIVFRHQFCESTTVDFDNFICRHSHFTSPQYIIDNDHVSLMSIDGDYAVFCEAKHQGVHLWRSRYNAFVRQAQLYHAKRLIRVPLAAFHRMSETIGDPRAQIVFLFNVARCGSTLFTQVMEHTDRCVCISEPSSPMIIASRFQETGDTPGLRRLARDVMRWECRPYQSLQPPPLAYVIKLTPGCAMALPLFRDIFPTSKCLFMYRADVIKTAKSFYRMSFVLPSLRVLYILGRFSRRILEKMAYDKGFELKLSSSMSLNNDLTVGVFVSSMLCHEYRKMRQADPSMHAFRYEDLVANPLEMCRIFMDYCGLPLPLAPLAVKALEVDSQENSHVSKSALAKIKEPEVTSEIKESLNVLLRHFDCPPVGREFMLDGTLKFAPGG